MRGRLLRLVSFIHLDLIILNLAFFLKQDIIWSMKVALVIDDRISRPGGIQEYVLGLYDFLEKHGHQPLIFTTGRYSKKTKEGRKIIGIGVPFEFLGNDAQKAIPLIFGQKEKIKRILKREKPDVVHIQGFPGPLSLAFLRYSSSVNVMTYHVVNESALTEVLSKTFVALWKKIDENLQGKIAISEVAVDSAKKFIPGPYKIIPIGIDFDRFKPTTSRINKFEDGKTNILFVGRLDKRKGIEYLLKAYQILGELLPNIRLIIVGDGPEKQKAKDYARKEKLKNVVFTGSVSRKDLPSWYATADIFCSPATHGESFGVVLLEAMASGLPVVAFDNPGYRSLLGKHSQGFLVFNKSISALAQALLILAKDKELRQKLGKQNRAFVKQFSWEKVGKEILKFYQVCKTKQRPKAFVSSSGL